MAVVGESRFEILPAIDLRGGRVVRLRQGDFDRETAYEVDPAVTAAEFAEAGARWLHVVDLDAARSGTGSSASAIQAIVGTVADRVSLEVAGGIRSIESAQAAIAAGAARVVAGTAALADPSFVGRLVGTVGAERVAVALDVRDGRAVGHGWHEEARGVPVEEALVALADEGGTTFEVTAIARDGLLGGPDLELLRRVIDLGRGAVIASGGIASIEDLEAVRDVGCAGAIIGRALYEGRVSLEAAVRQVAHR